MLKQEEKEKCYEGAENVCHSCFGLSSDMDSLHPHGYLVRKIKSLTMNLGFTKAFFRDTIDVESAHMVHTSLVLKKVFL